MTTYISNVTDLVAWSGVGEAQIIADFTISAADSFSAVDIGDLIITTVLDGNGHTVTVDFDIAFFNGLVSPRNNSTTIILRNIYINILSSTLFTGIVPGASGRTGYSLFVNTCSVIGTSWRISTQQGGIVGSSVGATITNCYTYGYAMVGPQSGGIGGAGFFGSITGCWSAPLVSSSFFDAGGIVGASSPATIKKCYSFLDSPLQGGGIAGAAFTGIITDCYSLGNITGDDSGGIAGNFCSGTIINCYTLGTITGSNAGGIVGNNATSPTLVWCYSQNAVPTAGNVGSGSIVGGGTCPTAGGSTIGAGNGDPWITSSIIGVYLTNVLTPDTNVWSDANKNSPPVLDGPFILTNFMRNPWNHTSYDSIGGFLFDFTCFFEGTQILTTCGYIPIESLKVGDICITSNKLRKKITQIGSFTLNFIKNRHIPRVIRKGDLGAMCDTYITFMHSLLFKDTTLHRNKFYNVEKHIYTQFYKIPGYRKLVAAHCNKCHLVPTDELSPHPQYFNLVLESENIYAQYGIYANGILMESCSKEWFDQSELKSIS